MAELIEPREPFEAHPGRVLAVAYAPDGASLATGSTDGTVRVWDARTGEQVRALTGHGGPVVALGYAPDGASLATGSTDGTVRVWDARTGEQVRALT